MQSKIQPFGKTADGIPVEKYVLDNGKGTSIGVITFGAALVDLIVPDRTGKSGEVTLGFDTLAPYEGKHPYFGATVGRVANRITGGKFTVDGKSYNVTLDEQGMHLHGGKKGYEKYVWKAAVSDTPTRSSVRFTHVDPDGTEGYPGTVNVAVTYTLTLDGTLRLEYDATTDKPTPINLTNHAYFNLKDGGKSKVYDHVLQIFADRYTPSNAQLLPTGAIEPVKGTVLDFTTPKPIGSGILKTGTTPVGYDHNFVLRSSNGSLAKAAEVFEPASGRVMETWTTEPAVQLYTGNFLDGTLKGRGGEAYQQHTALCLEAQKFPDAVNHPNFTNTILRPGEVYKQTTEYRFSVR